MGTRRMYHHTEHTDGMIRRAYSSENYQRGVIKALRLTLNWPQYVIYRRALELGVTHPIRKEPPWTTAEMALLEKYAHLSPVLIARKLRVAGYSRTPIAISIRRKRFLHITLAEARQDAGFYTARQLAEVMGMEAHAICSWIKNGMLSAQRAGTRRTEAQGGDHWKIREKDVRRFIVDFTAHVDFRKIDKYWLVDLLAGGGAKGAPDGAMTERVMQ